jgi:class 3 adenylate cyclase
MSQIRRLTAILAADVAGFSRLMGMDEEGTHGDGIWPSSRAWSTLCAVRSRCSEG